MTLIEIAKQKLHEIKVTQKSIRKKRVFLSISEDRLGQMKTDFIKFVTKNKDELPDIYERLEKEQRGDV